MSTYEKDIRYGQGESHVQYWRSPDGIDRENVNRFEVDSKRSTYHIHQDDASIYVNTLNGNAFVHLPPIGGVRNGQRFLIQRIGANNFVNVLIDEPTMINQELIVPGPVMTLLFDGECVCYRKGLTNAGGVIVESWYTCVETDLK